jgi:hypothetical protein
MLTLSFLAFRACPFCARAAGTRETNATHAGRTLPGICDQCRDELTRKIHKPQTRFSLDTVETNC